MAIVVIVARTSFAVGVLVAGLVMSLSGCSGTGGNSVARSAGTTVPSGPSPATSFAPTGHTPLSTSTTRVPGGRLPRPAHVLIAVLENHAYDQIVSSGDAPFLNSLIARGALLTDSFAITHPSQPNYLALFSGTTQAVSDDSCPQSFSGPNLGRSLFEAGFTFAGYSEDLPSAGYLGCSAGQ
ncbi:MAG: alkaline phosphatase family protein, partial [Actinomycetota bacterium]|nr:alkaline phosphatase family protein [Actinomycetota bacterium]